MDCPQIERGNAGPGYGEVPYPKPVRRMTDDQRRVTQTELACLRQIETNVGLTPDQLRDLEDYIAEKETSLGIRTGRPIETE